MISQDGIDLIKHFEGCELTSYKDSGGVLTIGYGHTKTVSANQTITEETATEYLLQDLKDAENRVNDYIHIHLVQCELDSCISSAYNIRSFPTLAAHMAQGKDVYLAKLLLYCHDEKGHLLSGLQIRRKAEEMLFDGMMWTDILPQVSQMQEDA